MTDTERFSHPSTTLTFTLSFSTTRFSQFFFRRRKGKWICVIKSRAWKFERLFKIFGAQLAQLSQSVRYFLSSTLNGCALCFVLCWDLWVFFIWTFLVDGVCIVPKRSCRLSGFYSGILLILMGGFCAFVLLWFWNHKYGFYCWRFWVWFVVLFFGLRACSYK